MEFTRAITRRPGPDFARGLTTAGLGPPDLDRACAQHAAYAAALRRLGLAVIELPALVSFPDACFVEDTAVVTPEVAVIARPGADARRGEERTIEPLLARYRKIERIEAPGTLDGGDVLVTGRRALIGVSSRTNADGAAQLARLLRAHGYDVDTIEVAAGLHLKSSVNALSGRTLLATSAFAGHPALAGFETIVVDDEESYAANTLLVNGHLLAPGGFPRTRRALDGVGLPVVELDLGEFRKMDGGLSCLSLRF